jgi:VanZ family protein
MIFGARVLLHYLRATFWTLLAAIVFFTLVPPTVRPVTSAPPVLEHAVIFLLTGVALAFAYEVRSSILLLSTVAFSISLELIQSFVPGRHARVSDALVDAASMCLGIVMARVGIRLWCFCRRAMDT